MQEISLQLPEHDLLPFMSFITAADALKALDRLGPAAGLDISTDGLRRLARLLNDNPSIDPLKYHGSKSTRRCSNCLISEYLKKSFRLKNHLVSNCS